MTKALKMDKRIGRPLGHPDNKGTGEAAPPGAGDEGGLGSYGDQRNERSNKRDERSKEPPLDGTMSADDIEGDTEDRNTPSQRSTRTTWIGARMDMETRKREPLITW